MGRGGSSSGEDDQEAVDIQREYDARAPPRVAAGPFESCERGREHGASLCEPHAEVAPLQKHDAGCEGLWGVRSLSISKKRSFFIHAKSRSTRGWLVSPVIAWMCRSTE
ncbi:MAG: hypothetical protein ACI89X_002159 [Planctomycetota bacterium]